MAESKDRGVEFDTAPIALLPILAERGVEIPPPHKGMGKAYNDAYKEWKNGQDEQLKFAINDNQGNPLNQDGTLKVGKISSIGEITDEDLSAPTRNIELPKLPKNVDAAIGAKGKPVVIKKEYL